MAGKRINDAIRSTIVGMYKQFVSEVEPQKVMDLLIQERVITCERKEELLSRKTRKERCRALLDYLFSSSNDKSFVILREALKDEYEWIVDRIDTAETGDAHLNGCRTKDHSNVTTQTEQFEGRIVPDHISNTSSSSEELLQKQLDLTRTDLERSRCNETALKAQLDEANKKIRVLELELKRSKENAFETNMNYAQNRTEPCDKMTLHTENQTDDKDTIDGKITLHDSVISAFKDSEENTETTLIEKRSEHDMGSTKLAENCAIVIGLDDGHSISKEVVKINLNKPESVLMPQQEVPFELLRGSTAAVYSNSIFVTGVGKTCDEIWRFDGTSLQWNKCASSVQGRRYHCVAFVDHVLYICGGRMNEFGRPLDVEAYDSYHDKCASVGKLLFPVQCSGNCVSYKHSLYIFGGCKSNFRAVQMYDTRLNACTVLSRPMPEDYSSFRAVAWENNVILIGCDGCLVFNCKTEVWEERDQFKTNVDEFGLIVSDGLVFVIGGGDFNEMKLQWQCEVDVKCVPVMDILNNEPIKWRRHTKLPKASRVHAFGKVDLSV